MFKSFLSNKRASFGVTFACFLLLILGAVGMSIDVSQLVGTKTKAQNALDAAILFAGAHYDQNGTPPLADDVEDFFTSNYPGPVDAFDFDSSGTDWSATAELTAETFFYGQIFPGTFELEVSATIRPAEKQHIEIALVLDNTGSMASDSLGNSPTGSPPSLPAGVKSKMEELKDVSHDFVGRLIAAASGRSTIKIALVPFDNHVNVGKDSAMKPWQDDPLVVGHSSWGGCIGARPPGFEVTVSSTTTKFPLINPTTCPPPVTKLGSTETQLTNGINAMTPSGGETYVGEGVMWGWRMVDGSAPFTGAKAFNSLPATTIHKKFLIVLTDGANSMGPDDDYGDKYHSKANGTAVQNDGTVTWGVGDDTTRRACEGAQGAGITVYTIVFGAGFNDHVLPSGAVVENTTIQLMEKCAGDSSRAFLASDGAALDSAFDQILEDIEMLHLSS